MGVLERKERRLQIVSGADMIARGAIDAGVRFYAGYPITPASSIYTLLMSELPKNGGVAIGAPDEISALCYCVGASMRGMKAMTATSGPGFALMVETIGYALMTETPVVIVLVQRMGPSTGTATQGAAGDLLLAEYCVSGGYPLPVICPTNQSDAYESVIRAVNIAETLRTPVILLTEKELTMTQETLDLARLQRPEIQNRPLFDGEGPFLTYGFGELSDPPPFVPVGSDFKVTITGSAHNKAGELRKDDPEVIAMLLHLEAKIRHHIREISWYRQDLQEGADRLVISFGVTDRAARGAVQEARRHGCAVSHLTIYSLFPVPETVLKSTLSGIRRIIIPEENISGLYRSVLRPYLPVEDLVGVNKVGGLITPDEILDMILKEGGPQNLSTRRS